MDNRTRFFDAFAHDSHVVMGRRLCKFTLRHRFWLEALESPIVTGGEISLVDVEMAARLCAIPSRELDETVPRRFGRKSRWWERLAFTCRVWRRDTSAEYEAFFAYLTDHGNSPVVHENSIEFEEETDGPPLPPGEKARRRAKQLDTGVIPGLLNLVTGLVKRSGWEPDTVWALGPGEAEWYLTGVLIHDGVKVPVKTPSDEEFEEGIRREREAAEEELARRAGGESQIDMESQV